MPPARRHAREAGQATVELVALLPLLALAGALAWQAAVAGQALWLAGAAARASARAAAVGADPAAAARASLPARLEQGLRVSAADDGAVSVRIAIPSVVGGGTVATTTARARFPRQGP
jgi:hypothetical protein